VSWIEGSGGFLFGIGDRIWVISRGGAGRPELWRLRVTEFHGIYFYLARNGIHHLGEERKGKKIKPTECYGVVLGHRDHGREDWGARLATCRSVGQKLGAAHA